MNTIAAFEKDVFLQVEFLEKFSPQKSLSASKQKKSIFCGTGDSYAAALLAESFSGMNVRVIDPRDLIANSTIVQNNDVYLISISGNTISNIKVAKVAKKSIAITANKKSKLVKESDKSIILEYQKSGVFTSGSIGFLSSALTAISLVWKFRIIDSKKLFSKALLASNKIKLSGTMYILGNFHTYPIAIYAAAKFTEILGTRTHYERIEQFSHMGLFSVKPNDTVMILEEKNKYNIQLTKNLKKLELNVIQIESGTKNKLSQVIFYTFLAQFIPLRLAKKKKQKECYFVLAKKIRNASSNMIY